VQNAAVKSEGNSKVTAEDIKMTRKFVAALATPLVESNEELVTQTFQNEMLAMDDFEGPQDDESEGEDESDDEGDSKDEFSNGYE
jgi:hypothetical protein